MKTPLLVTVCFFILFHTADFWGSYFSVFIIWIMFILFGVFLFVLGSFVSDLYYSFREKFQSNNRTIALLITSLVIGLTIYKPSGIINYEMFTANDILVADRGGSANCVTRFHLKKDGTYNETTFCFGLSRMTGVYRFKNDTIWFKSKNDDYEFGIIGPSEFDSTGLYLHLYQNKKDTLPKWLRIIK